MLDYVIENSNEIVREVLERDGFAYSKTICATSTD